MRGLLCIIFFSKSLHARPVLEATELPRECGTLAHCTDAEPLCVKIKDQKNPTVNYHFALNKCQLQLLKCQPGHVEAAPVPMKFCQGDQLSKDAGVIKKRVRRHLERRSNVENNNKVKRKSGRLLKKPSRDGFGATHTQKKFKNKPKPIRNNKNVRISKGKRSKMGKSDKRNPLVMIRVVPNVLSVQHRLKRKKKRGRPLVPGSLAAPLDYGAIFNNPNDKTSQGYTMDIDPGDPGYGTEENGEANQEDVGGNEGDGGVNEGDGEADEGDRWVNEGDGEADKGDRGVNEGEGGADEKNGGVNEDDGDANEDGGVKRDSDAAEGDGGVNDGDGGENEGDGWVNEGDGEVNEADGKPDEGDRPVNEGDGGANEGDGGVNEDNEGRGVANEENTVFWKGDNDEGNNADNVEGNVENGDDGRDNVGNEGGNNGDNGNNMIVKVKKWKNLGLWDSISNGLSVKVNLNVKSG